ncbi:Ubiquitin-specific protease family C19-related protein [Rhynchospora pubera]|uniref:Ubiquitin-specific protease family C19-related protein n=1 Tax=Rhynchospora pubera TaxID=906938 RepID=A0AAV8CXQ7_9POAL|nr:Ubiquitin-specific protease family C19-related protein [Rhynchospora pubera]
MRRDKHFVTLGETNDSAAASPSSSSAIQRRWRDPVPTTLLWVLIPLLLAGLGVSVFVLAVVHNALLFVGIIVLSVLVVAFLVWNLIATRSNRGLYIFLDRAPDSDLRTATDGQIVKITGVASCGDISLVSSYEKVARCVYTSTLLYTCTGWTSMLSYFSDRYIRWELAHLERQAADFYITDAKSGTRVLVKAGNNSKMVPLIEESVLVSTRDNNREISLTLKKWLDERYLSVDSHLLRLEEGHVKEGRGITAMGMLSKKNGTVAIVPPSEPFSTGCFRQYFLLPIEIDALLLKSSDENGFMPGRVGP